MRFRSASVVSSRSSGPVPSIHRPNTSAASATSKPSGKSRAAMRSRSLPYIAAPSVATVMITSSGPRRRCFAVFTAARMLQMLDRPKAFSDREHVLGDPPPGPQELGTLAGREEHRQLVGGPVGDPGHQVGVHHVVDERDVLVADALDVVLAEPVGQHRRALQRLGRDDLAP